MDSLASRTRFSESSSEWWSRLIAAHAEAMARYVAAADAAQGKIDQEEEVDGVLQELSQLEQHALTQPSADVTALRFKLGLWANGRVEGYEAEWRIFAEDCERFLPR